MLPSVESLRCFVSAGRLLNFRAAAKTVFLTPQAFSQRIKQLEDELGAPLFTRTTRSVRLTPEGLRLLPVAENALSAVGACAHAVSKETDFPATTLLVGTRHELGLSWVEPQLDGLAERLPWLTMNLYFGSGPDLVNRVRSMEIDCAITSSRINDPRLDFFKLHREDYVFVASPRLLRTRPLQRPEQAAEHVLIDVDDTLPLFRYWRDASREGDTMRFARLRRLGTIEAVRRRIRAGDGVGVLPRYLVQPDLKSKALVPLFPTVTPQHDHFRLVFRMDDVRRPMFETVAGELLRLPLQ